MTYLSVVAVSRNDDHGGDPLIRTQLFINCLAWQAEKYKLDIEIILVDWNPVSNKPPLSQVLNCPDTNHALIRFITVPCELHQKLKSSSNLHLFQMIGKNVGIRRAKGEFVLATNIDILFSNELIELISKRKLDNKRQYRVDRYDIKNGVDINLKLNELINYANNNIIRINKKNETISLNKDIISKEKINKVDEGVSSKKEIDELNEKTKKIPLGNENSYVDGILLDINVPQEFIHTNACGDFTLMSKDAWMTIRGYPEFESYSFNIDSMGVMAAHYGGYNEIYLPHPYACFHIEHELGSGWTPEGSNYLFEKLLKKSISIPSWEVLNPIVKKMQSQIGKALYLNNENWGLSKLNLIEMTENNKKNHFAYILETQLDLYNKTSSLLPEFDLDYLLVHQNSNEIYKLNKINEACQIYYPNSFGIYSEENSEKQLINSKIRDKLLIIKLNEFNTKHNLRIDLLEKPGKLIIKEIFLLQRNKLIISNPIDFLSLIIEKIDCRLELIGNKLHYQSLSKDPQIILKLNTKIENTLLIINWETND
jgi:hypothetical protein